MHSRPALKLLNRVSVQWILNPSATILGYGRVEAPMGGGSQGLLVGFISHSPSHKQNTPSTGVYMVPQMVALVRVTKK